MVRPHPVEPRCRWRGPLRANCDGLQVQENHLNTHPGANGCSCTLKPSRPRIYVGKQDIYGVNS